MPIKQGTNSIIHTAANANVTAFTYTQVYASAGASPTINDVVVPMVAGAVIDILVRTISSTGGIFVIGNKADTTSGSEIL